MNLLKKARLPEAQLYDLIQAFYTKYEIIPMEREVLLRASELREQYSLSFWDSLVIACALASGCSVLYTEDMQDGCRTTDYREPLPASSLTWFVKTAQQGRQPDVQIGGSTRFVVSRLAKVTSTYPPRA